MEKKIKQIKELQTTSTTCIAMHVAVAAAKSCAPSKCFILFSFILVFSKWISYINICNWFRLVVIALLHASQPNENQLPTTYHKIWNCRLLSLKICSHFCWSTCDEAKKKVLVSSAYEYERNKLRMYYILYIIMIQKFAWYVIVEKWNESAHNFRLFVALPLNENWMSNHKIRTLI